MKKLKKNEGFTLVELIIVIVILGILAAVAVPAYSGYLTRARDAAIISELDAIKTAAQAANAEKGSITKIVTSDASTVVITADEFATNFQNDFKTYYSNGTAGAAATNNDITTSTVTLATALKDYASSSYASDGKHAEWTPATGWEAKT